MCLGFVGGLVVHSLAGEPFDRAAWAKEKKFDIETCTWLGRQGDDAHRGGIGKLAAELMDSGQDIELANDIFYKHGAWQMEYIKRWKGRRHCLAGSIGFDLGFYLACMLHYKDRFNQKTWDRAMELVKAARQKMNEPFKPGGWEHWPYTIENQAMGWFALQFLIDQLLQDSVACEERLKLFQRYQANLRANGVLEVNSPAYCLHQYDYMNLLYTFAPNEQVKEMARQLAEYLLSDMFHSFHTQSGAYGGSPGRLYTLTGTHPVSKILLIQQGKAPKPFYYQYQAPEEVIRIATDRAKPFTVKRGLLFSKYGPRVDTTTYQHPDFSMGTCRRVGRDRNKPLMLTFTGTQGEDRSMLFVGGTGRVDSFQEEARAIIFTEDPNFQPKSWFPTPFYARLGRVVLSADEMAQSKAKPEQQGFVSAILLNGSSAKGDVTQLNEGDQLILQAPRAYLGIRFLAIQVTLKDGRTESLPGFIVRVRILNYPAANGWLLAFAPSLLDRPPKNFHDARNNLYKNTAKAKQLASVTIGYAVRVASVDEYPDALAFDKAFAREKITVQGEAGDREVTWKFGENTMLMEGTGANLRRFFNGKERRWDMLYDSPFLQLKPGEPVFRGFGRVAGQSERKSAK